MENSELNLGRWVDERLASLNAPCAWQPNATLALGADNAINNLNSNPGTLANPQTTAVTLGGNIGDGGLVDKVRESPD